VFREETIAATATAYGEGGIGIIRISGQRAKEILDCIFVPTKGKTIQSRKLTYGVIADRHSKEVIDEVLAVFMPAPYTYTREDVVEINCHGSVVALRKTLDLVLRSGAVLAEPGEFTKRAFLNGRIDLSQAEAVIDLVKAKTEKSFETAVNQLEGSVSSKVKDIRKELLDLLVKITVNIDYPDEDIEEITYSGMTDSIKQIGDVIEKLLSTAEAGRIIKDGLKVVICGRPNVGKSSLLNAMMKENRAIVTDIPGTTRDIIEETVNIRGIPVRIFDTAGIRNTDDKIEKLGIEKSKEAFNQADLIILILDGSEEPTASDLELLEFSAGRKAIVLINKTDIDKKIFEKQILEKLPECEIIDTAITEEIGIDKVEEKIEEFVYRGKVRQGESLLITNARHKSLLLRAGEALSDALDMAERKEALDFIEIDVRNAWELLGEITGETTSEDIINEIFAKFCLGK